MKKLLPILTLILVFLIPIVVSAKVAAPSFPVDVSARVGEFDLNLSGYISPFASVVLKVDGYVLRTTVADEKGNFSITGVPIKRGFSNFCLEAIDYKKLGSSLTCLSVPPATGTITMTKIFLPPTIGIQRTRIQPGGEAFTFGYTMPKAQVRQNLNNSVLLTTAQKDGHYEYHMKKLNPGNYTVYARAFYKGKLSLAPSKTLPFTVLSLSASFWQWLWDMLRRIWEFLTGLPLGPLWLGLPLLIAIILMLIKLLKPELLPKFGLPQFTFIFPWKRKKLLHHWWFVGY